MKKLLITLVVLCMASSSVFAYPKKANWNPSEKTYSWIKAGITKTTDAVTPFVMAFTFPHEDCIGYEKATEASVDVMITNGQAVKWVFQCTDKNEVTVMPWTRGGKKFINKQFMTQKSVTLNDPDNDTDYVFDATGFNAAFKYKTWVSENAL